MTTVNLSKKIIELEMNPEENKDEIRRLTGLLVSTISTGRITVDFIDEDTQEATTGVVCIEHGGVYVEVDGYSDYHTMTDGPLAKVEVYCGDLRIMTWSDINQEDETNIISFENALSSNRTEDLSY